MGDKASSGDDQVVIKEAAAWQEREPSQCLVNVVSSWMELLSPLFWSWKKEDAMKKNPEAMKEIFFLRSLQGRSCLVMSWQNLIPSSNSHITGIFWSSTWTKLHSKEIQNQLTNENSRNPFLDLTLTCLTDLYFVLKCSQFRDTLNFRPETLLLMEMIH